MNIKFLIETDFVNYKKPSMFIGMPICGFKCDLESGEKICQNSSLAKQPNINIDIELIKTKYLNNPLTKAIVLGGLEPFDTWEDLYTFIESIRSITEDDIVIYTGYNKTEIIDKLEKLSQYKNIIIKYGRFIPNQSQHYDPVLGVQLASDNQYAEILAAGDI